MTTYNRTICLFFILLTALTHTTVAQAPRINLAPTATRPASQKPLGKDMTALFDAAEDGDTTKIKALLDKGVSCDTKAPNGLTPLILASIMNHPVAVKLLLDRGADVNAALASNYRVGGSTALVLATNYFFCVMAGATTPKEPKGYYEDMAAFEKKHPDQTRQWEKQMENWRKGYGVIVQMLLDHGANVNVQTMAGSTAIGNAATSGELDMVRLLLDKGARLDLPVHQNDLLGVRPIDATNGFFALAGAASMGQHNPELIKLLLAHGASPNAKYTNDMTPLGRASESGDTEVVQILLASGADVNAYDGFGRTALMLAQHEKYADVVALLRKAGAKDLPQGAHTEVTLKKLGHEPNGDTKMQVDVTPKPGGTPVTK